MKDSDQNFMKKWVEEVDKLVGAKIMNGKEILEDEEAIPMNNTKELDALEQLVGVMIMMKTMKMRTIMQE